MARVIANLPNTEAPGNTYPEGRIKDNPGDNTGTKMNEQSFGDMFQFFARMLSLAGITPNGLPDNTINGYQLLAAFKKLAYDPGAKTTMSLINGFTATSFPPSWRKDCMGNIYLTGQVITPGGSTSWFSTLPVGSRPVARKIKVTTDKATGNNFVIQINPDGGCNLFMQDGNYISGGYGVYIDIIFNIHD